MLDFEVLQKVTDFIERGGNVLLVIAAVTAMMWTFIIERTWYYRLAYPAERQLVLNEWHARSDHSSWTAHQIRRLMISELQLDLERGLGLIKALVAVCPMLGLLGTVIGMVQAFQVIQSKATSAHPVSPGDLAGGIWQALTTTVAGLEVAIPTIIAYSYLLSRMRDVQFQMEKVARLIAGWRRTSHAG